MGYFDIVLIAILVFGTIKGFFRGLIVELFSLIAFFLGLFFALKLSTPLTDSFFPNSAYRQLMSIAVFFTIFIVFSVVVNLLARVIKKAVSLAMLGIFDRLLGSVFSAFKWALMLSIIIWVTQSLGVIPADSTINGSIIFPILASLAPLVFDFVGTHLPIFDDLFRYLDQLDGKEKFV